MTTSHRPIAAAAAATVAGLLLVACSSTSTVTAPGTPKPAGQTTPADPSAATSAAAPTTADPTTSSASAGGNACTLITEQDVTAALGTDPGPGTPLTHLGASQCQYGSYQTQWVLVNLTPSQGKASYGNFRNNPQTGNAGAMVDVAGVGDRAFEVGSHGSAGIYFNKGDALVVLSVVIGSAASPPMKQALSLAKTAASRI